jgi:hypothetical protein
MTFEEWQADQPCHHVLLDGGCHARTPGCSQTCVLLKEWLSLRPEPEKTDA